jgi:hypothetical protein
VKPTQFLAEPDFLALLRFWDDRRAGAGLPDWDGDLSVIPGELLPNLIIERRRPEPTYLYVGGECTRRWGQDVTGRRVYGDVLHGVYGAYIRSLDEDASRRRAAVFSAAVYRLGDDLLLSGRLFAPFAFRGSAEAGAIFGVQVFSGLDVPLAGVDSEGFVDELQRQMVVAVPALCDRLERARRYHAMARRIHQNELARELDAIAREFTGDALVPLPVFAEAC